MRPLASVLVVCLLTGCEETRERPADPQIRLRLAEEMFIYQVRLDDLREQLDLPSVRANTNLDQIERLESAFALSGRMLEQYDATGDADALHAGEVGRSFAGLGYEVIATKIDATLHGQGSLIQDGANRALGNVWAGLKKFVAAPKFFLRDPLGTSALLNQIKRDRDNIRAVAPIAYQATLALNAALLTESGLSLARLTQAGIPALTRLVNWMRAGGAAEGVLMTAGAGGAGVALVTTGGALVLTDAEVIALAEAGRLSTAALGLYVLARSTHMHHIATDKNYVSELRGGPWSPRFEELFKNAELSFEDPANLVEVAGHKGPHPEAYHREVFKALDEAVKELKPHTLEYRRALKEALRDLARKIRTPGSRLRRLLTQ